MEASAPLVKSRKPEDTAFKQQRLPAWQPILTPFWVISTFVIIGIVFLPLGIVLKKQSDSIVEYVMQYDGDGTPSAQSTCQMDAQQNPGSCTLSFTIEETMKAPVYVYYQLDNFYQNHRRYVKSRSDTQLEGQILYKSELDACEPLITTTDSGTEYTLSPCGLIANSYFNDVFELNVGTSTFQGKSDTNVWSEVGIAWESDVDHRFSQPESPAFERELAVGQACSTGNLGQVTEEDGSVTYWCYQYNDQPGGAGTERFMYLTTRYPQINPVLGVEDEHFIVWMRTAALPNFRKLYAKINTDLEAGSVLAIDVDGNFEVNSFGGKKYLVISTMSWFGGKNDFLGISYIVVGSICLALAVAFAAKQAICPRKLGDTRYLGWKEQ